MNPQTPTIGRIVIYKPTTAEQEVMKEATNCNISKELPAMIVSKWSDTCINAKVELDGVGQLWKTSISMGDGEGQWSWPVIAR